MDLQLKGKRALVLGGSDGLGYAIAESLYEEGADVVLGSRSLDKLKSAADRLRPRRAGGTVDFVAMDMTKHSELKSAAESLLKKSPIDILVTNTGGPAAGDPLKISLEDWDKGYQTLLRAVILMSQVLVPEMAKRQWGRILNITSTSAREIIPNLPLSSTFRSGLTGFTKELAKSVGKSGILVNNLLPGPTGTARLEHLKVESPQFYATMVSKSALGRVGRPDEIGRVAAFLCSGANTFLTGTDVLVDGGFTSAL